jgi:hypothetical protein
MHVEPLKFASLETMIQREVDRAVVAAATSMLNQAAKPHIKASPDGAADPPRAK